jgi:hypothetical protein
VRFVLPSETDVVTLNAEALVGAIKKVRVRCLPDAMSYRLSPSS